VRLASRWGTAKSTTSTPQLVLTRRRDLQQDLCVPPQSEIRLRRATYLSRQGQHTIGRAGGDYEDASIQPTPTLMPNMLQ